MITSGKEGEGALCLASREASSKEGEAYWRIEDGHEDDSTHYARLIPMFFIIVQANMAPSHTQNEDPESTVVGDM
jgi:hypothetical protein